MKKYRVRIYTTSVDFSPTFEMDEFELAEFLDIGDQFFLRIKDDVYEKNCLLSIGQIVGIEWIEFILPVN